MKLITLLLIVPTLMASAAALATEGRVGFTGQLTLASCAVLPPTGLVERQQARRVEVSAQQRIVVDTARNACAGQVLPFTTDYQPLSSAQSGQTRGAILTLTYQ